MSRGRPGSRWPRRLSALAMVAVTLAGTALPLPAQATGRFTARISAVDPVLPTSDSTINLTLELSNSTPEAVHAIHAHFIISLSPLHGRSQIPDVIAGRSLPTYRTASADVASGLELTSGASTDMTLHVSTRELGLTTAQPGVYVLGLVVAGVTGNGHSISQRPVTLLPWMPKRPRTALKVTTVWTLTAPPSRGVDGVFFNDSLAVDVSPGGRLRTQLDAMRSVPRALWLVDPLLVESLRALANGARIMQPNGDVRASTDAEMTAASTWLTDLTKILAGQAVAALPIGDLDLRSAFAFGRTQLITDAISNATSRLAAGLGETVTSTVVPIYGGAISSKAWRFLSSLNVNDAIVTDAGYPPEQQLYTPTSALAVANISGTVLVADRGASESLVDPGLDPAQALQAFTAQLLMAYLERPNSDRVITIAVPPTWHPAANTTTASVFTAPWMRQVGMMAAGDAGTEPRGDVTVAPNRLERARNASLTEAYAQQRTLLQLTSDPGFSAAVTDAVIGMLSRWWTNRVALDAYAPDVTDQLSRLAASVQVVTRGDIVFGGQKGDVPVTVANGLPVAVDIGLEARGLPSVRVTPRPFTPIHLNAGKRVSVEIPTQVTGSGDAYLSLVVLASDSNTVGTPVLLTVRSAAYARVASYVVAVAFVALLLLIGLNTVRRIRLRQLGRDVEE